MTIVFNLLDGVSAGDGDPSDYERRFFSREAHVFGRFDDTEFVVTLCKC
jgi:hypothetical protein